MTKRWQVVVILLPLLAAGCDDNGRLAEANREAANRQAEQNRQMAELQSQVAEGTRRLVEEDAKARAELTAAQREVQRGHEQLEADRRTIAQQRNRDPIVAAAITTFGVVLACLAPLLLCYYLLRGLRDDPQVTDQEITQVLIQEIVTKQPILLRGPDSPLLRGPEDSQVPGDSSNRPLISSEHDSDANRSA